jgi:glutamate synthase (NADPH/NADH) small chain
MFVIECDTIFRALGQTPREDLAKSLGLRVNGSCLVSDDPRVFVGGDCGNGGAEIVNAAAEGVSAAKRIHLLLSNKQ